MPQAATRRARNCQCEPCRSLMFGKPARRRLAANAPRERSTARSSDFCRRRKMFERRRTTFHCTVTACSGDVQILALQNLACFHLESLAADVNRLCRWLGSPAKNNDRRAETELDCLRRPWGFKKMKGSNYIAVGLCGALALLARSRICTDGSGSECPAAFGRSAGPAGARTGARSDAKAGVRDRTRCDARFSARSATTRAPAFR